MSKDDDTLLARWSRRKRAVAAEQASSVPVGPSSAPEDGPQGPDEELSEAELLEKLGLPDPDTLTKGDDFSAFMKARVPDALRRRALRKLWLSDPVLANLDGLIDHGEDYTDAAMVPETLKTAYQVGKGILRQIAEAAPESDQDPTVAPEAIVDADDPDPGPAPVAYTQPDEEHDDAAPRPARMAFRTD